MNHQNPTLHGRKLLFYRERGKLVSNPHSFYNEDQRIPPCKLPLHGFALKVKLVGVDGQNRTISSRHDFRGNKCSDFSHQLLFCRQRSLRALLKHVFSLLSCLHFFPGLCFSCLDCGIPVLKCSSFAVFLQRQIKQNPVNPIFAFASLASIMFIRCNDLLGLFRKRRRQLYFLTLLLFCCSFTCDLAGMLLPAYASRWLVPRHIIDPCCFFFFRRRRCGWTLVLPFHRHLFFRLNKFRFSPPAIVDSESNNKENDRCGAQDVGPWHDSGRISPDLLFQTKTELIPSIGPDASYEVLFLLNSSSARGACIQMLAQILQAAFGNSSENKLLKQGRGFRPMKREIIHDPSATGGDVPGSFCTDIFLIWPFRRWQDPGRMQSLPWISPPNRTSEGFCGRSR